MDERHVSARALERLAFDPGALEGVTGDHARGCASCRGEIDRLLAARDAFLRARPADAFFARLDEIAAERSPGARLRTWWRTPALGLAFTAALAVLWLVVPRDPEHTVSLKGGDAIGLRVYASRGGAPAEPLGPEQALFEGDVVRFSVTPPVRGYLLIADLDGRGRASLFVAPRVVEATPGVQLMPGSIELDDYVGEELVVAVLSPHPLDADAVLRALEASEGDLDRLRHELAGAAISAVRIRKSRR